MASVPFAPALDSASFSPFIVSVLSLSSSKRLTAIMFVLPSQFVPSAQFVPSLQFVTSVQVVQSARVLPFAKNK